MLAEKFFLVLETIKSRTYSHGSHSMASTSRHVPMDLPNAKFAEPDPSTTCIEERNQLRHRSVEAGNGF
jgi:hypothetical protein